jgi:DNA repair protein RadC
MGFGLLLLAGIGKEKLMKQSKIFEDNERVHIYKAYAFRICVVRDKQITFRKEPVSNQNDGAGFIREVIKKLGQTDRENMVAVMLNTKNCVIGINLVSVGSLNASYASPREVFKAAINSNCAALILGHNHPSGVCQPSTEDMIITKNLVMSAEILGFIIHDHLIVDTESDNFYSFSHDGILDRMKISAKETIKWQ